MCAAFFDRVGAFFNPALAGAFCDDRVLDRPTLGGKGSKRGPYQYCNLSTWMHYHRLEAVPWLALKLTSVHRKNSLLT